MNDGYHDTRTPLADATHLQKHSTSSSRRAAFGSVFESNFGTIRGLGVLLGALLLLSAPLGCGADDEAALVPADGAAAQDVPANDAASGGESAADALSDDTGAGGASELPAGDDVMADDVPVDDVPNEGACGALSPCDAECVDLAGDSRHCGTCGTACDEGEACVTGACVDVGFPCVDRWIGSVGDGVTLTDTTLGKGSDLDGLCLRSGDDEDTAMYWQVPMGGDWEIRFSSSDFDVVAQASSLSFPGVCMGNEIDCNDDGNGPNGALLSFSALEGQQILISVDAFRDTGAGEFTMSFKRSGEAPVSDGA